MWFYFLLLDLQERISDIDNTIRDIYNEPTLQQVWDCATFAKTICHLVGNF